MRAGRVIILAWAAIIVVLVIIEIAELTHVFTLPLTSALVNLVAFIVAIVFITILALVGALFIGMYISTRMRTETGFTAFEEEMLKMRADVRALREEVEHLQPPAANEDPAPGPEPR